METKPSDSDEQPPVWDCLRQSLEQMRAAGGRKIDPQARAKKLAERARLVRQDAGAGQQPASAPLCWLAFRKGRERYGIPLEYVVEVQALEQFSPVPGCAASIRGVVHWRGAILALLDLTRLFEIAETGLSDLHAYVVVEAAGKRLALAASVVEDIVAASQDRVKAAPQLPRTIAPEWVVGVHDENRLILKMDEIIKHLGQNSKG
jgi:purine-binding chemotaxis protein CheW